MDKNHSKNKKTLIKGSGGNQHTLYGDFKHDKGENDLLEIEVEGVSVLHHEQPDGSFSNEHEALEVDAGSWVQGRQVEFNPFKRTVSQIWD